jgi:hypothetical protein
MLCCLRLLGLTARFLAKKAFQFYYTTDNLMKKGQSHDFRTSHHKTIFLLFFGFFFMRHIYQTYTTYDSVSTGS